MDIAIQIEGLDDIEEKLANASQRLVRRGFTRALQAGADTIAAAVRAAAPRGEEGLLKESVITWVDIDIRNGSGAGSVGFDPKMISRRTEKPADAIALWVEYGHREVLHDRKTTVGETQPKPFMRSATMASAERAIEAFVDQLNGTLESSDDIPIVGNFESAA